MERFIVDEKFTENDLDNCWQYYKAYSIEVLNGEYDLNDARADLRSLMESAHDNKEIKKDG